MPASVYKLVFQDPNMKKLDPSSLEIGTYTTDTVNIVGSCVFYLVHLNTKKLMEVTFYVAMKDGSLLLSCKTTLMLGLIQPRTRLSPSKSNLITSSADHQKKTKATLHVQKQEVSAQTTTQTVTTQIPKPRNEAPKLITSKDQILYEYPDVLMGLATSWDHLITYRLIQVLLPSKHLAAQSLYILKKHSSKNKQDVTGRSTNTSQ